MAMLSTLILIPRDRATARQKKTDTHEERRKAVYKGCGHKRRLKPYNQGNHRGIALS